MPTEIELENWKKWLKRNKLVWRLRNIGLTLSVLFYFMAFLWIIISKYGG